MKKILKGILSIVLSAVFLAGCVFLVSFFPEKDFKKEKALSEKTGESSVISESPDRSKSSNSGFMKAVWVPFMSLDMGKNDRSRTAAEKKLNAIFEKVRKAGADTAFLHVRPFCDALYKSKIFPSSHLLSGVQGKDVDYDFLETAIKLAKKQGIHIHAWINPLRVSYSKTPSSFADSNPCMKWKNDSDSSNDNYTFTSSGNIYLNPAYPEVRRLIVDGVREIVKNYDVDGVVIDDYFYPPDDMKADQREYELYSSKAGETYLSQNNWRKQNINTLLCSIYSAVHYERSECLFGISPQCNMENDEKLAADIKSWSVITGYCDYISPQTYVSEYHPLLPFGKCVDEWRKLVRNENVKLYISLSLYKEGTDADDGTWLKKKDNISSQIAYLKKAGADGYVLYSCEDLDKVIRNDEKTVPAGN